MNKKQREKGILLISLALLCLSCLSLNLLFAAPEGPTEVTHISNLTKAASAAQMVNISGGRIAAMNLTATIQNPRWKAFVGDVIGSFTLDDATGSTIYDWSLTTVNGRVYATKTSGAVDWVNIGCADVTDLESENTAMEHSNVDDNITATFSDSTHDTFWVGSVPIGQDSCPTLNTYVNNNTQDGTFEEMVLYDSTNSNAVYATILEADSTGFNGEAYDFQMIVPENGNVAFTGATAYYLYVEIGT